MGISPKFRYGMKKVLLFVKDFELGAKISSTLIDRDFQVEFSDEQTDPSKFTGNIKMAIVDMDEKVFLSVGLVSELNRRGLKVIGTMEQVENKNQIKLKSVGCDLVLPKKSFVRNLPNIISELIL